MMIDRDGNGSIGRPEDCSESQATAKTILRRIDPKSHLALAVAFGYPLSVL